MSRGLKNRTPISNAVDTKLWIKFQQLSKETRIPQSRLLDEAIELLLEKYSKPTEKQAFCFYAKKASISACVAILRRGFCFPVSISTQISTSLIRSLTASSFISSKESPIRLPVASKTRSGRSISISSSWFCSARCSSTKKSFFCFFEDCVQNLLVSHIEILQISQPIHKIREFFI